jgi:hypothetical protein
MLEAAGIFLQMRDLPEVTVIFAAESSGTDAR